MPTPRCLHAVVIAGVLLALPLPATSKAQPRFWAPLVAKDARWVLRNTINPQSGPTEVIVETYDVRTVGDAQVARLRWRYRMGGKLVDLHVADAAKRATGEPGPDALARVSVGSLPTQLAVT